MFALRTTSLLAVAVVATGALSAAAMPEPRDDKICGYGKQGIKEPKPGAVITLNDDYYAKFEVVYCSGQYYKTQSETLSVWVANAKNATSGELVAPAQKPDNKDTDSGFYSYRFNATYASAGSNTGGDYFLSVYETATGYGNAENYFIYTQPITVKPAPSKN